MSVSYTHLDVYKRQASRMRPTTLDEVVGQQHIVGKDKLLYRAIKADSSAPSSFTGRRAPERLLWQRS